MLKVYVILLSVLLAIELYFGFVYLWEKLSFFWFMLVVFLNILFLVEVIYEAKEWIKKILAKLPKWLKKLLGIKQ